jgi:hypothetical protein
MQNAANFETARILLQTEAPITVLFFTAGFRINSSI